MRSSSNGMNPRPTTCRQPLSSPISHNYPVRRPDNQYRRSNYPPDKQFRRPNYPPDNNYSHPPPPPRPSGPSFIIDLISDNYRSIRKPDVDAVISNCKSKPERVEFNPANRIAASLYYTQWVDTLECLVWFWEARMDRVHNFTPKLNRLVSVPSDLDELQDRLKALFTDRIKKLMEDGDEVKKMVAKRVMLSNEIERVTRLLARPNTIWNWTELRETQKRYKTEIALVDSRVSEFKTAMNCLLAYIDGEKEEAEECSSEEEGVKVLKFSSGIYDWSKIQSIIARECRRLDEGLPIYGYRQQILDQILTQQVTVLIGETGSGKSTQLVQFLADSGVASDQSIVCTQPRKIAAMSLSQRVREESIGCYKDNSIACHSTFFSRQAVASKIVFLTDHCLLQYYMNDTNMSVISCIIVDEAHERSLSTDLLLASIKDLLGRRPNLRLVIMSATADADVLSEYFYCCGIFHVMGRSFPVDVRYVPSFAEGTSDAVNYVADVLRVATEVHRKEKDGTILAFLTSQMEVEWACEKFIAPGAIALPLHGKLSFEDQFNVFQNYPGKRKVIFATNLAETSLTIPGVKYVIDSGMVKESKFEPGSGMSVLKVCRISQSSANQRSGRAGRTEPGICYRLYSEYDFEAMPRCQEPEIRRVHLGVAVLRILALGIKNLQDFEFIDAPCSESIDLAIRNLVQLGAVKETNGAFDLTQEGWCLIKLGVEPRLGKLILGCHQHNLRREGLVLAAVMANASNIFCRVGNDEEKLRSDCLKVQFCHRDGDLFTLLSVFKKWDSLPREERNKWCWENSINAKTMRRCQDTLKELEFCLQHELNMITPGSWRWDPLESTDCDRHLKKVILSSLAENVAMFSGYDQLGYEVALTGKHVRLHPSCSLLVFGEKPSWVVFGEILSISSQYLVCVTSFDFNCLSTLYPPPLFDVSKMESRKLQLKVLTGFGCNLLKRFCGKGNSYLLHLVSHIRKICKDEIINIKVDYYQNDITLFATSHDMDRVSSLVYDALECEKKWMRNECLEKCLYHSSGVLPSIALFGAGAEIKHLELQKRCLTVDVVHSKLDSMDDKELFSELEKAADGSICAIHKFAGVGHESVDRGKSVRITFLSPDAAQKAAELNESEFSGSILKVIPSQVGGDQKMFSFPAVRAKVYWPRRLSKGFAIVKTLMDDVNGMVNDFSNLLVGERAIRCEPSTRSMDSVVVTGLQKDLSEAEILDALRTATSRPILDFFLLRGEAVENPPCGACEEALLKEISPSMPKRYSHNSCSVQVFEPEPKNTFMRAMITFDGRLHLEAAKALEQLEGKVLPGFHPWQKMKCQQLFHSSLSCSAPVYLVIKKQLDSLLSSFVHLNGVECSLDRNANGSYRVKISANATKTVADLRKRVEELVKGKTIDHPSLTPTVLQLLFSRDGISLMHSLQRETGTHIFFDRRGLNVQVYGSSDQVSLVQQKLVDSLLSLHENKLLEVRLQGKALPPELMKEVVNRFGPDLRGLREKVPGADLSLNVRRQVISIHGNKDLKQKVEENIYEIAQMSLTQRSSSEADCPICLCEIEDEYRLEGCGHLFCRLCLVEQCESAIKNQDSFPMCCAHEGCRSLILFIDLRSLLLSSEKLEELFRASLGAFVGSSGGIYRFCPSPDCSSVYQIAAPGTDGEPFVCGACYAETCTRCHLEYHPYLSCEQYREFKEDPDSSLLEWCKGKEHVKSCPVCRYTIEKIDGCNHIACRCGKHICWVCLEYFGTSDDCYGHLRNVHMAII